MLQNVIVSLFHKAPILFKPFFGPSLYRCHGFEDTASYSYIPGSIESISSTILNAELFALSLGKYYVPYFILSRGGLGDVDVGLLTKFGSLLVATWLGVGIARAGSSQYQEFLTVLATQDKSKIRKFDFDMRWWPVDFDATQLPEAQQILLDSKQFNGFSNPIYSFLGGTLGRALIMPGSLGLISSQMMPHLLSFRAKMVERFEGKRARIQVSESSAIDTMFMDRRESGSEKGNTLFLCSEGNAAFYELGIMQSPLQEGYSVLGWNRPGFAESTGSTCPANEKLAIKALLEYAKYVLKFDNIILFGWSIGGYPTAVGANAKTKDGQPLINGVILDATFDHIKPMAGMVLPGWFEPIALGVIEQEWDLDVSSELCKYKGNVVMMRRLQDEILSTGGPSRPDMNRINWLLYDLVLSRFPVASDDLMNKIRQSINKGLAKKPLPVADDEYERRIFNFINQRFIDVPGGHNNPLPQSLFRKAVAAL